MKKLIIMTTVLTFAAVSMAGSLAQGTRELVVQGSFDPDDATGTSLSAGVLYGEYIQDDLELGGEVGYADMEDLMTTISLGAFVEKCFPVDGQWVPFLAASLGWSQTDLDEGGKTDGLTVSGAGGVKMFVSDNVAIRGSVIYTWASDDIFVNDGKVEDTDLSFKMGMAFYLPPLQ